MLEHLRVNAESWIAGKLECWNDDEQNAGIVLDDWHHADILHAGTLECECWDAGLLKGWKAERLEWWAASCWKNRWLSWCWHYYMLEHWSFYFQDAGLLECWNSGIPESWNSTKLVCWHAGTWTCWHAGTLESCRHSDTMEWRWHVGMLTYMNVGVIPCHPHARVPGCQYHSRVPLCHGAIHVAIHYTMMLPGYQQGAMVPWCCQGARVSLCQGAMVSV